ncbi:MAG: cupin domain-containing protein [Candidatus Schekmanbacteria bacterium]|nr:cupin domain-containing protein [Candidatus Schekmanbacteria bacterium]
MSTKPEAGDAASFAKPVATQDVSWETWAEGTRFGTRFRHLTSAAGVHAYHVGVQIDELEPGKQSCPAHYHLLEEEHLLVLEGRMTLRLGDETHELEAGDYACFPAGQRAGHCLVNNSTAVCRFVTIGERSPNEVCVYTDSHKVMVRALGEIYDKSAVKSYWDGE